MQKIKIGDNLIDVLSVYGQRTNLLGSVRESLEIMLESNYETVKSTFVDNMTYSIVETVNVEKPFEVETTETVTNENGEEIEETKTVIENRLVEETHEYDKSDYCLSCDIVDHRNGKISVFMGKKTNEELERERANEAELALYDALFSTVE